MNGETFEGSQLALSSPLVCIVVSLETARQINNNIITDSMYSDPVFYKVTQSMKNWE